MRAHLDMRYIEMRAIMESCLVLESLLYVLVDSNCCFRDRIKISVGIMEGSICVVRKCFSPLF